MRLTALPTPPPTPTTFIRAVWMPLSSSSNLMVCSLGPSEEVLEPPFHRSEHLLDGGRLAPARANTTARRHLPCPVEHEARGDRHARRLDAVRQAAKPLARDAASGRHGEDLARQLHDAGRQRAAAREDDAGGK